MTLALGIGANANHFHLDQGDSARTSAWHGAPGRAGRDLGRHASQLGALTSYLDYLDFRIATLLCRSDRSSVLAMIRPR